MLNKNVLLFLNFKKLLECCFSGLSERGITTLPSDSWAEPVVKCHIVTWQECCSSLEKKKIDKYSCSVKGIEKQRPNLACETGKWARSSQSHFSQSAQPKSSFVHCYQKIILWNCFRYSSFFLLNSVTPPYSFTDIPEFLLNFHYGTNQQSRY